MDDCELTDEVLELALLWHEGQATEEERARLERLLADREEARELYVATMEDTITLADLAGAKSIADRRVSDFCSPCGDLSGVTNGSSPQAKIIRFARRSLATRSLWQPTLAAATVLIVIWGGLKWLAPEAEQATNDGNLPLARIVSLSRIDWAPGAEEYDAWSRLEAGDSLQFASGMLELLIGDTVQVILQGPVEFDLLSPGKARAREGKLALRVGPEAIGFEIETPHANIIDLGTSISMAVRPDERTDVVVYDGSVDLSARSHGEAGVGRSLTTGEAPRIGSTGTVDRITTVEDRNYLPPPQLGTLNFQTPRVITAVTDSASLSDTAKYHRIMGGGITEDCPAYVDRLHEWNGIDERGIPSFLDLADYVMGFNDDKVSSNLEVTVSLSQPARLYVLWDDRVPVPDWLRQEFTDSESDIGLDEGFVVPGRVTSRTTEAGAGKSVDRIFSIWQRDVKEVGSVVLGPMQSAPTSLPPRHVAAAMYGIAAVPLADLNVSL